MSDRVFHDFDDDEVMVIHNVDQSQEEQWKGTHLGFDGRKYIASGHRHCWRSNHLLYLKLINQKNFNLSLSHIS